MLKNILKSFGAILAGFLTGALLSIGTDLLLENFAGFPKFPAVFTSWGLALAVVYRSLFNTAGSYLAATLAPSRPMVHSMILGGIGIVLTVVGMIAMWGKGPEWYPVTLLILTLPCVWLGGRLRVNQVEQKKIH